MPAGDTARRLAAAVEVPMEQDTGMRASPGRLPIGRPPFLSPIPGPSWAPGSRRSRRNHIRCWMQLIRSSYSASDPPRSPRNSNHVAGDEIGLDAVDLREGALR